MIGDIIQIPLLGGDTEKNIHQTVSVKQTDEYFTAYIPELRVHVIRAKNLDDVESQATSLISRTIFRRYKTRLKIVKNWFHFLKWGIDHFPSWDMSCVESTIGKRY